MSSGLSMKTKDGLIKDSMSIKGQEKENSRNKP